MDGRGHPFRLSATLPTGGPGNGTRGSNLRWNPYPTERARSTAWATNRIVSGRCRSSGCSSARQASPRSTSILQGGPSRGPPRWPPPSWTPPPLLQHVQVTAHGQDRERLVVARTQPGQVGLWLEPFGPVAQHRGQDRGPELGGADRVDQPPRVGAGHDHAVLAGDPAVQDPGRSGAAEGEVPVRPDRWAAAAIRVVAAQRRRRQVDALQPGHPAALGLEAGVEGAQAAQGRFAERPGGGDVEVDVAGRRVEVAKGQRPVQVQPDQLVAEGLGDAVPQPLNGPVDLRPGRRPGAPAEPGHRRGGPPVGRGVRGTAGVVPRGGPGWPRTGGPGPW